MANVVDADRLIDLVFTREPLWNPKNGYYHNRELKNFLWNEIATELGATRESVRTKWSCLRDSFRRELKKRNDTAIFAKGQWPFFERMLFLSSAMNPREPNMDESCDTVDFNLPSSINLKPEVVMSTTPGLSDLGNNKELPSTSDQMASNYEVIIKEEPNAPSSPTTTYTATPQLLQLISDLPDDPTEVRKKIRHRPALEIAKERLKLRKTRKKLKREKNRDGNYYFALSLVSSMRSVPESSQIEMRVAVMDAIKSFLPKRLPESKPRDYFRNGEDSSNDVDTGKSDE